MVPPTNISTRDVTDFSAPLIPIETPDCVKKYIRDLRRQPSVYKPSRAMRLVLMLMARIQIGDLEITLPDERVLKFTGQRPGPSGKLVMHNDRVARKFLIGGQLGFCESYLDGDWSSPDIATFFELILKNSDEIRKTLLGKRWVRFVSYLVHTLKPNSKRGSRKNIYSHYDIGNDFYARWLDPSMTYSSAFFGGDETLSLEDAQAKKYQKILDHLGAKSGDHILEIGCGWGGFAEYAASKGCKVTGITVSQAQYDYARERIQKAGFNDNVNINLQDYRDLEGQFDHIASIEMFEAVGEPYWPVYFDSLKKHLKPGGKACLQIITINDRDFPTYRKSADYIQRYIFPGGMLPSLEVLHNHTGRSNLEITDVFAFGPDYATTLALWNQRFQAQWPKIKSAQMDQRFKRLWEQYLCYCQAGFAAGKIDVIQATLTHAK